MENRGIVELLNLLKDYIIKDEYFKGMCIQISLMVVSNAIDTSEEIIIRNYLKNQKPLTKNHLGFWWTKGNKKPRLDWIDKQIKKLES